MYLKYGNYQHASNESSISVRKRAQYNDRGFLDKTIETWGISGTLIADGQSAIRTAAALLQDAYSKNQQFAGLYHDDGTLSHLYLDPSFAQIHITGFGFPVGGGGAEYATGRHYEIEIEAVYPSLINGILSFTEQISFQGNGGPRYTYFELMQGPPVRQTVGEKTLYRTTQSGSAVGQITYPTAPDPLWPPYLENDTATITTTGGNLINGNYTGFGVVWSYQFISDIPLSGTPTLS